MTDAKKLAEELLPHKHDCDFLFHRAFKEEDRDCPAFYRPAVAAKLREMGEENERLKTWRTMTQTNARPGDVANIILERDELRTSIADLEAVQDAWHSVFGTTQLTHAQARLEAAERDVERLRAAVIVMQLKVKS